jgi:hypothetical protein
MFRISFIALSCAIAIQPVTPTPPPHYNNGSYGKTSYWSAFIHGAAATGLFAIAMGCFVYRRSQKQLDTANTQIAELQDAVQRVNGLNIGRNTRVSFLETRNQWLRDLVKKCTNCGPIEEADFKRRRKEREAFAQDQRQT